ncbi:MAG: OsmC family protein [Pseudomonadota bacterium]
MKTFSVSFPEGKKVDVTVDSHTIKTDQSPDSGGQGSAPEPFDLFLSSLAACAGIYAKSFCDYRNLSTQGMHLTQTVSFNPEKGMIEDIRITLVVNPDFPEKYNTAILKSMNGCAVKRHLNQDIPITVTLSR